MARRSFAKRQDKNHNAVRDYLRKHGVEVIEIFNPLDLLVYHQGFTALVEVKDETDNKQVYTDVQIKFISEHRLPIIFATGEEQSLNAIKQRQIVTERQKQALAGMLLRNKKPIYTAKDVRDAINN